MVASIVGTSAYNISSSNTFALNPGISATFPWLSTQAVGWEQYHFNKLKFCYYTRTGSDIPGSVQLIPDYDAADSAPLTEQIASAYEDVREDVPWKDIECMLDSKAMHPDGPKKYIRTSSLSPNLDIKTYDVGNFFVATTDGSVVNWGKLWVEYDVVFHTPQLPSGGGNQIVSQTIAGGGTVSSAAIFGSAPVSTGNNVVTAVANTLTFNNVGFYFVSSQVSGTNPVVTGISGTVPSTEFAINVNSAAATATGIACEITAIGQTLTYALTGTTTSSVTIVSPISQVVFNVLT